MTIELKIQVINDFLEEEIDYYSKAVKEYNSRPDLNTEKLDKLFRDTLSEVWNHKF